MDSGVYEVAVSNGIDTIKSQSKLEVCIKPKVEGKSIIFRNKRKVILQLFFV